MICTTVAAADGSFSCTPLDPTPAPGDTVSVTATDPSGNESEATEVTITSEEEEELGQTITGSVFTDTNRDGTQDAAEDDVSGARIDLFSAGPDESFGSTDDILVGSATTASPFEFSDIDDGLYQLRLAIGTLPAGIFPIGDGAVDIEVDGAPVVAGVSFAVNTPEVSGTHSVAGATVTVTDSEGNVFTATTDASGNWSIEGVALGEVSVRITNPNGTVSLFEGTSVNASSPTLTAVLSEAPPALAFTGLETRDGILLSLLLLSIGLVFTTTARRRDEVHA